MQERYQSIKLKDLLDLEDNNSLFLPNFQREFKWSRKKQRKLLSSYIVGIPVGGILLLEGDGDEFASRKLCYREENRANPQDDCIYLLDGQQRISTLKSVFSDFFRDPNRWEDEQENLYPKLRYRWFIDVKADDEEPDIFGLRDLVFNQESILKRDAADLENHIEQKRINRSQEQWYNPNFVFDSFSEVEKDWNKALHRVAEKAAEKHLVPLFSVRSDDSIPLHESTLELIASKQIQALKAEVRDGDKNAVDLLEKVEPSIESYIDEDNDRVEQAWNRLANRWKSNLNTFIEGLISNEIPLIRLGKTEIDRAVSIFDNMNKGGTPLSTFDLVAAKAAKDQPKEASLTNQINDVFQNEFDLPGSVRMSAVSTPKSWKAEISGVLDHDTPPTKRTRKQFLNILSILNNGKRENLENLRVPHIKKKEHLALSSSEINKDSDSAAKALSKALAFLQVRCGITKVSDVSYDLLLVPISYALHNPEVWESKEAIDKIEYWYWSSILSGHYREKQNPRCIEDTKLLYNWLAGNGKDPFKNRFDKVLKEPGYSDKAILLRDIPQPDQYGVPGAVRDTLLQYVLSRQPYDFLPNGDEFPEPIRLSAWDFATSKSFTNSDEESFDLKREAHHICPLGDAASIKESTKKLRGDKESVLNSPLNLTYISGEANRRIRDKSPEDYISYLSELSTSNHFLPPASEFEKRDSESKENYYQRICERRYELLRQGIRSELDKLRSS